MLVYYRHRKCAQLLLTELPRARGLVMLIKVGAKYNCEVWADSTSCSLI